MGDKIDLGLGIEAAGAQESEKATKGLIGTLKNYIGSMLSMSSATEEATQKQTNHIQEVAVADRVYEKVGGAMRSMRNKLLAFAGVYAASDIFSRAIEEGKELQEIYTNLANRFGNEQFAQDVTNWIVQTSGKLPVARDELVEFTNTMDNFAIPPQLANLEGVLGAALGPGESLSGVMSDITSLAQSGDVQPFIEAFAGRISPQEIAESLQGAMTIQERIIALTDLLNKEFSENIERQRQTVSGQMGLLRNVWDLFKQAFVGMDQGGTIFGEFSRFVRSFVDWFVQRKGEIIEFGSELGSFFGNIFRLVRKNFFALGDFNRRMFNTFRGFIKNSRELVNPFVLFLAIMMEKVKTFFGGFKEGFVDFFVLFGAVLSSIVKGIKTAFEELTGLQIAEELEGIRSILRTLIGDDVVEDVGNLVGFITGGFLTFIALRAGIGKVVAVITSLWGILKVVGAFFLANPVVAGITALAGAAVFLYQVWDNNLFGLRDDLEVLFNWLQDIFEETSEVIVNAWEVVASDISEFVGEIKPELRAIWSVAKPLVQLFGTAIVESVKFAGQAIWDFTYNTVVAAFNIIKDTAAGLWEIFKGVVNTLVDLLTGDFSGVLKGLKQIAQGMAGIFRDNLGNIKAFMVSMFSDAFQNIISRIDNMASAWKEIFVDVFNWLAGKVNTYILNPLSSIGSFIGFDVPTIRLGGETETGGGNAEITFNPNINQQVPQPARADATGGTVNDNRSFKFEVVQRDGESPESMARRIWQKVQRMQRRESERQ